jgi:hypothetical protein
MAGTIVADTIQADSTSTLVLKNGVANTPPTIQDSAGTQIGTFCRAFVNFNGTTNVGGFCTIRASFNVTTVADNGTGAYTVNFTNALPDANYSIVGSAFGSTNGYFQGQAGYVFAVGSIQVATVSNANVAFDASDVSVAIFR